MIAMVVTALLLTYSVISRYFFHAPTDWQDEMSVFMLVGVTVHFWNATCQLWAVCIGIRCSIKEWLQQESLYGIRPTRAFWTESLPQAVRAAG